jgi:hypothetical protein
MWQAYIYGLARIHAELGRGIPNGFHAATLTVKNRIALVFYLYGL